MNLLTKNRMLQIVISTTLLMVLFDFFFMKVSPGIRAFMFSNKGIIVRVFIANIGLGIACWNVMNAAANIRAIGQRRWPALPRETRIYRMASNLFLLMLLVLPLSWTMLGVLPIKLSVLRWAYPVTVAVLYGLVIFLRHEAPFEEKRQGPFGYPSYEKGVKMWKKQNDYT